MSQASELQSMTSNKTQYLIAIRLAQTLIEKATITLVSRSLTRKMTKITKKVQVLKERLNKPIDNHHLLDMGRKMVMLMSQKIIFLEMMEMREKKPRQLE